MIGNETWNYWKLFESLLQNYQKDLKESMRGNKFFVIVLIYCITIFKKYVWKEADHI